MSTQRARSTAAKQQREQAILAAAARLAGERGIRKVTLTDIAEVVGMHKSALLRYFETREQIFLLLTADAWREWGPAARAELAQLSEATPAAVARVFAETLTARPTFCDLLAQAPLNLERNVSLESVKAFKLVTQEQVGLFIEQFRGLLPKLGERDTVDVIAAATSMAGAFWQMASPGPELQKLYRTDPALLHAVVDVEPRLTRILTAQLTGLLGSAPVL
jgi:AcrR family transcriptional regulator